MDLSRRQNIARNISGLYVIIDAQAAKGKDLVDLTSRVLAGGASTIQLRDKINDKGYVLPVARRIRQLCEDFGALLIINDHADLAIACDAHGLHLGQHDLPIQEARDILHPDQIIGTSNALLGEAVESERQGADYLAVGAIFPTNTKEGTRPAGLETLEQVAAKALVPVVAIGGINHENVRQVMSSGADAACVVSAVIDDQNPEDAARRLVESMTQNTLSKQA